METFRAKDAPLMKAYNESDVIKEEISLRSKLHNAGLIGKAILNLVEEFNLFITRNSIEDEMDEIRRSKRRAQIQNNSNVRIRMPQGGDVLCRFEKVDNWDSSTKLAVYVHGVAGDGVNLMSSLGAEDEDCDRLAITRNASKFASDQKKQIVATIAWAIKEGYKEISFKAFSYGCGPTREAIRDCIEDPKIFAILKENGINISYDLRNGYKHFGATAAGILTPKTSREKSTLLMKLVKRIVDWFLGRQTLSERKLKPSLNEEQKKYIKDAGNLVVSANLVTPDGNRIADKVIGGRHNNTEGDAYGHDFVQVDIPIRDYITQQTYHMRDFIASAVFDILVPCGGYNQHQADQIQQKLNGIDGANDYIRDNEAEYAKLFERAIFSSDANVRKEAKNTLLREASEKAMEIENPWGEVEEGKKKEIKERVKQDLENYCELIRKQVNAMGGAQHSCAISMPDMPQRIVAAKAAKQQQQQVEPSQKEDNEDLDALVRELKEIVGRSPREENDAVLNTLREESQYRNSWMGGKDDLEDFMLKYVEDGKVRRSEPKGKRMGGGKGKHEGGREALIKKIKAEQREHSLSGEESEAFHW